MEFRTFHNNGRTSLVLLFSSFVGHLSGGYGIDLMVVVLPSHLSLASFCSLDTGYLFDGFQHCLSMVVQQLAVIFGALAERCAHVLVYSMLNRDPFFLLFLMSPFDHTQVYANVV